VAGEPMRIPDEIRTERLVIRPFRDADTAGYLEFMTDPRATRYLSVEPEQKTAAGARTLLDLVRGSYESDHPVWALAIEASPRGFVGSCGVAPVEDPVFECYYSLLPRYWGCGYATEAAVGLLGYLFEETAIREIRAYMGAENWRSAAVADRIGMRFLGVRAHPHFGKPGLLYVVTREQWQARARQAEERFEEEGKEEETV